MNGSEAASCGAEAPDDHWSVGDLVRLAVRVNSHFDIFILPNLNISDEKTQQNSLDFNMVMSTPKNDLWFWSLISFLLFLAVRAQTTVTRHSLRALFEVNLSPI